MHACVTVLLDIMTEKRAYMYVKMLILEHANARICEYRCMYVHAINTLCMYTFESLYLHGDMHTEEHAYIRKRMYSLVCVLKCLYACACVYATVS